MSAASEIPTCPECGYYLEWHDEDLVCINAYCQGPYSLYGKKTEPLKRLPTLEELKPLAKVLSFPGNPNNRWDTDDK